MEYTTDIGAIVRQLRSLADEERYDDIVEIIFELEKKTELPPNLLVWKAVMIQLSSGKTSPGLEDSEAALKRAIDIDDNNVEALLELGWFSYAVNDNSDNAKPLFEKALALSKAQMLEATLGMAKCLEEIEGKSRALEFLDSALAETVADEKISEFREELEANNQPETGF